MNPYFLFSLFIVVGDVTAVPPDELGHWVWVAGGAGGLCLMCVKLWKEISPKEPVPPLHRAYADREETQRGLQALEDRMEAARLENKADFNQLHAEITEGLTEVRDRVNEILVALAKLNTKP